MKNLSILSLILLSSCASTQTVGRFEEPLRTSNYISCLQSGLPITVCQCVEETMFKRFGTEKEAISKGFTKEDVLMPVIEECSNKVLEEMAKNMGVQM